MKTTRSSQSVGAYLHQLCGSPDFLILILMICKTDNRVTVEVYTYTIITLQCLHDLYTLMHKYLDISAVVCENHQKCF